MYNNILTNWFYGQEVNADDMKLVTKILSQACFAANGGNPLVMGITPIIDGNNIVTTKGFVYFGETSDTVYIDRSGTNQLTANMASTAIPLIANGYLYVKPDITYDINNKTSIVNGILYTSTNTNDTGIKICTIKNSVVTEINSINPKGATDLQKGVMSFSDISARSSSNQVTAKSTPIFATGEQYVLSVNFEGSVTQTIVLNRRYVDGTSVGTGTDFVELQLTRNKAQGHGSVGIKVIATSLPITLFGFKAYYLTAGSVTISGVIIPAQQVIFTMYLKTSIQNTNTINNVFGDYLSASQEFIQRATQYPILFEPVAAGAITGSVADIAFTTNATIEYVVDRYQDVSDNTTTGEVTIGGRVARAAQTMQSTNGTNNSSQVRTDYVADAQGTKKPVFNAGVYLPTGANASFKSVPADVGSGYNGWYQVMQNSTSSTIYSIVESYYINATGRQLVGMYATNNGNGGNSTSGVFCQSGLRPYMNNTVNLDKTNPESIATLADITSNGGGIIASGSTSSSWWYKFANGITVMSGYVTVNSGNTKTNLIPPISKSTVPVLSMSAIVYNNGTNSVWVKDFFWEPINSFGTVELNTLAPANTTVLWTATFQL
jgi:hypothetical protein